MSIDIGKALQIATQWLPSNKLLHSIRVASHVAGNKAMPIELYDDAIVVALLHDILEDSDFGADQNNLKSLGYIADIVVILTHDKGASMNYPEYCRNIKPQEAEDCYRTIAYFVKLADMKDHLSQKETLTDKLKEKYLEGLAELL